MLNPNELNLPYASWRPGQRLAIRTVLAAKTPHIAINAPTGAGKSAIAAALPILDPTRRHVILTATKALHQEGYRDPFTHLVHMQGASNYPCLAAADEHKDWFPIHARSRVQCDEGPCHLGSPCSLKEGGCTYYDAKRTFIQSQAGVTNYAAWLSNRRVGHGLGHADRLVCDEAHALPEQLMAASRIDIPRWLLDGAAPRGYKGWRYWAEHKLSQLAEQQAADSRTNKGRVKAEQLERGLKLMATMDHTWAWDHDDAGYHFEPVIPKLLMPTLQTFSSEDRRTSVVYLSATINSALFDLLGIPACDVTFHRIPSTFSVARRPVYFVPGVRADFRTMQSDWAQARFLDAIVGICELRDDRRGLIHSVSFDRAAFIYNGLPKEVQHRIILHQRGESAAKALTRFQQAPADAILVSPSFMTGFNFQYRAAEFQIIPKLPFPNTQSSIMRARCKATPRYRDHFTMQLLVQAAGRIVRADDDQGETFVTDEVVRGWYKKHRDLAPESFDEAVVQTGRRILPMEKLA